MLVGHRYFEALRIPLLSGRRFRVEDHRRGILLAVINRTLADRYVGGPIEAVGQTIMLRPGGDRTIVGVVENTAYLNLSDRTAPIVYVPGAQEARQLLLHIGTLGDPAAMIPTIHAVAREVDPRVPLLRVRTFGQLKGLVVHRERLMALTLSAVGWTALLLSALGLYGLVAYSVVTRTREIGVRAALGALRRQILTPFLRDTTRLVLMGGALGVGVAVASSQVFENQLYGVGALSPTAYLGAIALLAVVSLLALLVPLRRALQVNPAIALRSE